jgi:hypothetical protein
VSRLVHISMRQYAVISVRRAPHCERLVVAYPDERTLRDLLAEPSIVATGYDSRAEAEASICRYGSSAQPLHRRSWATLVANSKRALKEVPRRVLAKETFSLGKTQSAIHGLLHQTFVAAIVLLYSKNVLSAAIRVLISS